MIKIIISYLIKRSIYNGKKRYLN